MGISLRWALAGMASKSLLGLDSVLAVAKSLHVGRRFNNGHYLKDGMVLICHVGYGLSGYVMVQIGFKMEMSEDHSIFRCKYFGNCGRCLELHIEKGST